MSRNTTTTLTWTLTVIPEIDAPVSDRIDHASFRYGRTTDELEDPLWQRSNPMPSGILHVVKESELEGDALETGFVIEMSSRRKQKSEGWFMFQCALLGSHQHRYRKRGVYVCAETTNSMEMMNLSCCPPKELPKAIWIRVSALSEKTLAWVLSSSLMGDSNQTSLRDFSDLDILPTPPSGKPLALPGPPNDPYEFL